ncbi:hypothetical protein EC609_21265 [Achromobacter denitrificans]|nr:hypothetical protein EC609_21265 [Achromobacter denitrificans]
MNHTGIGTIVAASLCVLSQAALARPTQEQMDRVRAFNEKELPKCYALPEAQAKACVDEVIRKGTQMLQSPASQPGPAKEASTGKAVPATLVYECNVPAFAQSSMTSSLAIWRDANARYFAVSSRDPATLYPLKAQGTPGKGNAGFTFPGGASMTVAANGWTTTSQDQIHNKNSLYGKVSAKPNTEPGQCRLSNGKTTRTFNLKN